LIKNFIVSFHYHHEEAGTDNSATASLNICDKQTLKLFLVFVTEMSCI